MLKSYLSTQCHGYLAKITVSSKNIYRVLCKQEYRITFLELTSERNRRYSDRLLLHTALPTGLGRRNFIARLEPKNYLELFARATPTFFVR